MSWTSNLNLFYRGARNYIQGSLATSSSLALWASSRDDAGDWKLVKVAFTNLLNGHYRVSDGNKHGRPDGKIDLAANDGRRTTLYITPDPERRPLPPRQTDSPGLLEGFDFGDNRYVETSYNHAGGLDQFLLALIEANKRWHSVSFPGARDIWFLSLYETALPIGGDFYQPRGRFTIQNQSIQKMRGRVLTMNRIGVFQEGGADAELVLIFSFGEPEQ